MNYLDLADWTLGAVILCGVPAYLVLQVWTLCELADGCRFGALLPPMLALAMIAAACDGNMSLAAGPALLTICLFAPAAAVYLAALTGLAALRQRFDWSLPAPIAA